MPPVRDRNSRSSQRAKTGQGHRREIPGTRKFYAGVRAYAAAQEIGVPLASRENGSRTKAKRTYSYPNGLIPAYVTHWRTWQPVMMAPRSRSWPSLRRSAWPWKTPPP